MDYTDDGDDELFYYDLDDATEVVWNNIPFAISEKFAYGEIYRILEIEYDYLDDIGILIDEDAPPRIHDFPLEVDWEKLKDHMLLTACEEDIDLTMDELEEILDAELIYYDINGALGDAGEYFN